MKTMTLAQDITIEGAPAFLESTEVDTASRAAPRSPAFDPYDFDAARRRGSAQSSQTFLSALRCVSGSLRSAGKGIARTACHAINRLIADDCCGKKAD